MGRPNTQFLGELHDLMSKLEIFAQLADDIRQVERVIGSSSKGNGKLRHLKSTGTVKIV